MKSLKVDRLWALREGGHKGYYVQTLVFLLHWALGPASPASRPYAWIFLVLASRVMRLSHKSLRCCGLPGENMQLPHRVAPRDLPSRAFSSRYGNQWILIGKTSHLAPRHHPAEVTRNVLASPPAHRHPTLSASLRFPRRPLQPYPLSASIMACIRHQTRWKRIHL